MLVTCPACRMPLVTPGREKIIVTYCSVGHRFEPELAENGEYGRRKRAIYAALRFDPQPKK